MTWAAFGCLEVPFADNPLLSLLQRHQLLLDEITCCGLLSASPVPSKPSCSFSSLVAISFSIWKSNFHESELIYVLK